ncbi:MAG: hypothetical protein H7Z37_11875 [Pyrinomonadaceae bacterium]|nr:hypothetical protein [Pyrinomonadaceae bacterium]
MQPIFELDTPLTGFDETVLPNWLMVPLDENKTIFLRNGEGMIVTSVNPRIADVSIIDPILASGANGRRTLSIKGNMHGHTFIEVRDVQKRLKARLEVAVKKQKTVTLAFNFVEDNAGHKTNRKPDQDVDPWIEALNNIIYTPQTNVVFIKHSVRWVKVNANLGNVVGADKRRKWNVEEWISVVAQKDKTADINLFFVWELDFNSKADNVEGGEINKDCLIEDNLVADKTGVTVIAHEIGHALGVPGESHYYKNRNAAGLMFHQATGGFRIGKVHANMINR